MKTNRKNVSTRNLLYAAVCLALCLLLPFVTGQIPEIGKMLLPMHFPVLLAGFLCGPWWALAVGAVAPLLRFVLTGMPPIYPTGTAMAFELAAYGVAAGLLWKALPKKTVHIYTALVAAMLLGRVVWGRDGGADGSGRLRLHVERVSGRRLFERHPRHHCPAAADPRGGHGSAEADVIA